MVVKILFENLSDLWSTCTSVTGANSVLDPNKDFQLSSIYQSYLKATKLHSIKSILSTNEDIFSFKSTLFIAKSNSKAFQLCSIF